MSADPSNALLNAVYPSGAFYCPKQLPWLIPIEKSTTTRKQWWNGLYRPSGVMQRIVVCV